MTTFDPADIHDQLLSLLDYADDYDIVKARSARTLIRQLLVARPARVEKGGVGGESIQFSPRELRLELEDIEEFIATQEQLAVVTDSIVYTETGFGRT